MVGGSVLESTIYGGQGTDFITAGAASTSISQSVISGNLGADTIMLNGTTSVFNTEVYGSDSAGTDTGIDSLVISARTVQTSTVYGGAGTDTLILGDTVAATQIIEGDFNAFAGNDSVAVTGSFVSTTVTGGTGDDTIFISGRTNSGEGSSHTSFYGGKGTTASLPPVAVSVCLAAPALIPHQMALIPSASTTFLNRLSTVHPVLTASCFEHC